MQYPKPGELTIGWRWVLTLGWVGVVVGLMAVADTARVLNKPPFWLDHGLIVVPFTMPVLAAAAAFANHRLAIWLGAAAAVTLGVLAVVDVRATPGIAASLGVLALVGALTTLASLAGRMPTSRSTA